MSVFRIEKTKNYTVMSNHHLREKDMSLKAKGLLSLMLSLPDDWDYSMNGLASLSKDNITSIKSSLKELKAFGYLEIKKYNPSETTSGRFEYEYIIYEEPKTIKQEQENQKQALKKQEVENLPLENLPIENMAVNKVLNNKVLNNKEKDISNKLDISKKKVEKKSTFKKPTVDEVRAYCTEANINIDADRFIDFYESKGWKVGSAPMKDWKAAARNWSRRVNNTPAMSSPSINKTITPGSLSSFTLEDLESKMNRRYEAKAREMMDRYERELGVKT